MFETIIPLFLSALAPSAAPAAPLPAAALRTDEKGAVVHWKGAAYPPDALPEEMPEVVAAAVASWAEWGARKGYRLDVDDEGRVILMTMGKSAPEKDLELVAQTTELFDRLLPAPERTAEDLAVREVEWGAAQLVPDRDPVVLVRVKDPSHYDSLLDQMASTQPDLSGWARSARGQTGFVSQATQAGAWLEAPPGLELGQVWRSENELVNRLTQLLFYRRFGTQPHWFKIALAWNLEQGVLRSIYSFPGRDEFVGIGEHSGWEPELKRRFKKRKHEPLAVDEVATWKQGEWDMQSAQIAWGLMAFLAEHRPDALSAIAEDLRKYHKAHSIITHPDGKWEIVPGYEVPAEVQAEIIRRHAGEDCLAEASEFFRKGKRYKPSKTRR